MAVVLVTGATSGIGKAIALAFAARGDNLVLVGRSTERGLEVRQACENLGVRSVFLPLDVTAPDAPKTMVDEAESRFGRLDVACNNAGWQEPRAPLGDQDDATFDRVFDTNVRAVMRGMRAQLAVMVPRRSGVIINVGSVSAVRNPNRGLSLYSASKAALASMTRSAAMEYGPLGVSINLVSPGRIVTPMMLAAGVGSVEAIAETLPVRRIGEPADVAAAVLWLASPQAGYVIGHDLRVDGGFCAT